MSENQSASPAEASSLDEGPLSPEALLRSASRYVDRDGRSLACGLVALLTGFQVDAADPTLDALERAARWERRAQQVRTAADIYARATERGAPHPLAVLYRHAVAWLARASATGTAPLALREEGCP